MPPSNTYFEIYVLLQLLRGQGVTRVVSHYAGGGDSGGIDDVTYFTADGEQVVIDEQYHDKLEAFIGGVAMPQTGWWNDAGGFGTVVINTETGDVVVDHHERYDTHEDSAVPPPLLPPSLANRLDVLKGVPEVTFQYTIYDSSPDFYDIAEAQDLTDEQSAVVEAIQDFLVEALNDLPEGENGGSGRVVLHVPTRALSVAHQLSEYGDNPQSIEFSVA